MNKEEQLNFIKNNYILYSRHTSKRKIRHDIFKNIRTEIQAYLLGFFASDGNINEKRKTIRIHLQKSDQEIIYLFKNIISPEARVFVKKEHDAIGRNGIKIKAHESIGIDISSTILCNDLVNLGYGYNKTYSNLLLPKISDDLIKHFIRGYFDGDGSISGHIVRNEINKNPRLRLCFSICSKTDSLLKEIKQYFNKHDINVNINFANRDKMFILETSSIKECKKIFDFLYNEANFYMNRKYVKYNHYVNTEVSQLIAEDRNA